MKTKFEILDTFYRIESYGSMTKYVVESIKEDKATFGLYGLTDLRNEQYNLRDKIERFGSSEFGIDVVLNKPNEFFFDFEQAKIKSIERFNKEVNPDGKYKVVRYFDDVFETYVTGILSKKDAESKVSELNKQSRHYVSFGIVSIN